MSMNSVGRPTTPQADTAAGGFTSLTGGRGLLQDEALIFEMDGWSKTGVDLPEARSDAAHLEGMVHPRAEVVPVLVQRRQDVAQLRVHRLIA